MLCRVAGEDDFFFISVISALLRQNVAAAFLGIALSAISRYTRLMRIINIMLAKGMGGIEQSFLDYTHALQRQGHEVFSITHPKAEAAALIDSPSERLHTVANMGEWDPFAVWRLRRLMAEIKPHVCVAHGNRALGLMAKANAARLVTVLHNYKIRAQSAHAVIAPTKDLMRYAAEQGVPRERIHLVPNMVRVPHEIPRHSWQPKPVIGAMGRMVAKKGFEVFLASLAMLRERGVAFHAILAGDGDEMAALRAQAARESTAFEVEFIGWVKDKHRFFSMIDIFCLPSHHEPFGIVLLEAMAQGLPVISTASEGPGEIIDPDMNGLLTPVGDATAMADAIEQMLMNPRTAQLMARNGYDTVREKYDLNVVAVKLDQALRTISST